MNVNPTILKYGSSQEAWEGINEYFLTSEDEIVKNGGITMGSSLKGYDFLLVIRKAWINPEMNFAKSMNYHVHKWKTLTTNYLNINYFELVKSDVLSRENKTANDYNVSYIFANSHLSGKGCLLSATFVRRRANNYQPFIIAVLRSSEIFKRLPLDLLLLQRMGEYIYGDKADLGLQLYIPNAYTTAETSTMYDTHKPLVKVIKPFGRELKPFQKKVWETYKKYKNVDPSTIKYKIHLRAVTVAQSNSNRELLAKNLNLNHLYEDLQ